MDALIEFTKGIIMDHGYTGIFWLTAAEQFIFPIPVDFFVGLGTSLGMDFKKLLIIIFIATFAGAIVGYFLGKYLGHPIVKWIFGQQKLDRSEKFIKKWGMIGIMLAGLTPIPFKIVTWTAGIFEFPFWKFLIGVFVGRIPRYFLTAFAGAMIYQTKFYATTEMSALILGALQGVTEFLPISSSGHLILMEQFLYLPMGPEELAMFDIILHGGSLLAIVAYFWKDWVNVIKELWKMITKFKIDKNSMAFKLAVGTIPAIIAGLAFGGAITGSMRNITSIGILFIILAVVYFYAAWKGKNNKGESVTLKKSVLIGCAQAMALIPGVSRAGSTIAAGVLCGLKRETAAKFSFMLGGVAILAANVYALLSVKNGAMLPDLRFTLLGLGMSFVVSLGAIIFLLRYLQKHTMRAFGVYLLLIGVLILSFM